MVGWHSILGLEGLIIQLGRFLHAAAVLAVWIDADERVRSGEIRSLLERWGFRIEAGTRCGDGLVLSARRRERLADAVVRKPARAARRHVVQDDRQRRSVRDILEMRQHPGLRRFAVIGHDTQQRAQRLGAVIAKLNAVLSREGDPAPLKYALHLLGVMPPNVRLPLVEPSAQTKAEIATAISELSDCYADEIVGRARVVMPGGVRAAMSA